MNVGESITPSCQELNNGAISLSMFSNIPNETSSFVWSNGITDSEIIDVAAGTYSLTIEGGISECELIKEYAFPNIQADTKVSLVQTKYCIPNDIFN